MINRVCEKTLMYAFQKQNRLIDDYMVKYVADHELINGEVLAGACAPASSNRWKTITRAGQ